MENKPTYEELQAQVEAFKKIREDWKGLAINDAKTLIAFIDAADKSPQHHLTELRAEAVKDFIEFMYTSKDCQLCSKSLDKANQYAGQIQREGK